MKNTINNEMMRILKDALGEYSNSFSRVSISGMDNWFRESDETIMEWSVNWASIGDADTNTVREVAAKMTRACEIVDALNAMKMVRTYEHDNVIVKMVREDREAAIEWRDKVVAGLADAIDNNRWDVVAQTVLGR